MLRPARLASEVASGLSAFLGEGPWLLTRGSERRRFRGAAAPGKRAQLAAESLEMLRGLCHKGEDVFDLFISFA